MAAESLLGQIKPAMTKIHPGDRVWLFYYINLAALHTHTGRFTECLDVCSKAERIKVGHADTPTKAMIDAMRATAFLNLARYSESLQNADKALNAFRKVGKETAAADVMLTKGKALLAQDFNSEAIWNFSEALYLSKKNGSTKLEALALMELGWVFRQLGLPYLGLDHFREAESKFYAAGAAHEQARAIYERAATYIAAGNLKLATNAIRVIEKIQPKHPVWHGFLNRLYHKILSLIWSNTGSEDKYELRQETPKGPWVLPPTTPLPLVSYRGQTAYFSPCLPTLYRNKPNDHIETFIAMLRTVEFELLLRSHPYVKEVFEEGDAINTGSNTTKVPLKVNYTGLAQHYELQTDMMDFTSDKWVAAFFATNCKTDTGYKPVRSKSFGVFYTHLKFPDSHEIVMSPTYQSGFQTIGLQPLPRPGVQKAFALKLKKGENMNQYKGIKKRFFQHDLQVAEIISNRMNHGKVLFPDDIMADKATEIKESRKLSIEAFDLTWKRHPIIGNNREEALQACRDKGLQIVSYKVFRLPKELNRRFKKQWKNGGKEAFLSKIVAKKTFSYGA